MQNNGLKKCPFTQKVCIANDCQIWVEGNDNCAIINAA